MEDISIIWLDESVAKFEKVPCFNSFVSETKTPLQLFLEIPIQYREDRNYDKNVTTSSSVDTLLCNNNVFSKNSLVFENKNISTTTPLHFYIETPAKDLNAEI